jgi:hypothetical protein
MTIKLADLSLPKESQHSYCGENNLDLIPLYVGILKKTENNPALYPRLLRRQVELKIVSAVRFALREERCDMIPKIVEFRCAPPKTTPRARGNLSMAELSSYDLWSDQFGNSWFVTLQYDKSGWLVTLGGRERPDGTVEWQLYMD